MKEVEIAAQAGYQAIEPWVETVDDYAKKGGSLKDLKQRIADLGLTVESAIGFAQWIVDDDARLPVGVVIPDDPALGDRHDVGILVAVDVGQRDGIAA